MNYDYDPVWHAFRKVGIDGINQPQREDLKCDETDIAMNIGLTDLSALSLDAEALPGVHFLSGSLLAALFFKETKEWVFFRV